VLGISRSSAAPQPGLCLLEGPQAGGGRAQGHLPGRRCRRRRGRADGPSRSALGARNARRSARAGRRAWGEVIPFYAFPTDVRRILYTTNAIEALNSKRRRAVQARGHYPSGEATTKLLFLVLNRAPRRRGLCRRASGAWPRPSSPSSPASASHGPWPDHASRAEIPDSPGIVQSDLDRLAPLLGAAQSSSARGRDRFGHAKPGNSAAWHRIIQDLGNWLCRHRSFSREHFGDRDLQPGGALMSAVPRPPPGIRRRALKSNARPDHFLSSAGIMRNTFRQNIARWAWFIGAEGIRLRWRKPAVIPCASSAVSV